MKYFKLSIYILIAFTFLYLITHLTTSINTISIILINFFKSIFPYLLTFLIINQLLIKTKLLYLFSSLLQPILFPLFKINSKEISLILISILNGFPSSFIYSSLMKENNDLNENQIKRISNTFFLPSYTFIFFIIKNNLNINYFYILILSLYLPCIIILILTKRNSDSEYIHFSIILSDIKTVFQKFEYIDTLKNIFTTSLYTLVNILGMITFYSLLTIIIPSIFIKGLFEFSIPSISLLSSDYTTLTKTYLLLILLAFSSLSSISQASIYFEKTNNNLTLFIKKRITLLSFSLLIFTLSIFVCFLLFPQIL